MSDDCAEVGQPMNGLDVDALPLRSVRRGRRYAFRSPDPIAVDSSVVDV